MSLRESRNHEFSEKSVHSAPELRHSVLSSTLYVQMKQMQLSHLFQEAHSFLAVQDQPFLSNQEIFSKISKAIEYVLSFEQQQNQSQGASELQLPQIQENEQPIRDPCNICYAQQALELPLPCRHRACKGCLHYYLQNKIKEGKVNSLSCVFDGCQQLFTQQTLKKLVTPQDFSKFQRYLKYIQIEKSGSRWCATPDCNNGVDQTGHCKVCSKRTCVKCGQVFHGGKSCQQVADQNYLIVASDMNFKNCPSCKSKTHKAEGCNHITCTRCGYQYCWLCLSSYSEFHFSQWNIFGCAGLQHNNDVRSMPNKTIIFIFCLIPIIAILPVVIAFLILWVSLSNTFYFTIGYCECIAEEGPVLMVVMILLFPLVLSSLLASQLLLTVICPCYSVEIYERNTQF